MNKRILKKAIKRSVKPFAKVFLSKKAQDYLQCMAISSHNTSIRETILNYKQYNDVTPGSLSSSLLYRKIFNKSRIIYRNGYLYTFDPLKVRVIKNKKSYIASITPDYNYIIKSNLTLLKDKIAIHKDNNNSFYNNLNIIVKAIEKKASKIEKMKTYSGRQKELCNFFSDFLYRDCVTFDEAIQKILFYNGLFWQSHHYHNGLGRLDYILVPYYKRDCEAGIETYESAKEKLKNFCLLLGSQTIFKSMGLIGDTGQYILLGGVDRDGKTIDNDITKIFLEIFTEIRVPDPKLIFRENENTPLETWQRCMTCLSNGCGSPLIMNEKIIMENMVKFGYSKDDVWNVGTSACWEPLIIGKSACQNNPFSSIVACDVLSNVLLTNKDYLSFESLLSDIQLELSKIAPSVIKDLDFDYSPLYTLFNEECIIRGKDFAHKGAKYMYQGVQLLSLPNLVNSLLNIKKYVYDKNLISLNDCREVIRSNYEGREDLKQLFSNANTNKFGSSSPEVLSLCNKLIDCVSKAIEQTRSNGEKVKFGLSSPMYIGQAINSPATLDGRKAGEPYAVHISPISSSIDINEILQFAGELEYSYNCLNGNVVDFIIPASYQKMPNKLVSIVKTAFEHGLYQLQLNMMDRKTLIDAKAHPEKYPTLVVRIWGFSAYFNDLPDAYKDNLIARTEIYETV